MKNKYVKSKTEYDKVDFEKSLVKQARKITRKMPTSVSLPQEVVDDLKNLANKKGIPYQVLMRSFIIEGLEKLKAVS